MVISYQYYHEPENLKKFLHQKAFINCLAKPTIDAFEPFLVRIRVRDDYDIDFDQMRYYVRSPTWPNVILRWTQARDALMTLSHEEFFDQAIFVGHVIKAVFLSLCIEPEDHIVLGEN